VKAITTDEREQLIAAQRREWQAQTSKPATQTDFAFA
jgi:hypothetical protein